MKRLSEEEMETRYGFPRISATADDAEFKALLKALPEPAPVPEFANKITDKLLQIHRREVKRRRMQWFISTALLLLLSGVLAFSGNFLPDSLTLVIQTIRHYRWVCLFAIAVLFLFQYLDGLLAEQQFKKQINSYLINPSP